ncbi:MAG TPA: ABC transporter ATP-binding protein [Anaerolineales bacterium]|nr:ABC transporter ATP-binding protein [Anaerolineales bacterium]
MTPKLQVRGLSKAFRDDGSTLEALRDFSLQVEPGQFVTIIGPSGCGKSTLFNLIVGLDEPDAGEIWLDGSPVPRRAGLFGYMPQRDLLLPWRSVVANASLARELHGVPPELARAAAAELLPLFGLQEFASAYPAALSGGMRQRVALLRTILTDREVLLLDEPFGALDALTRRELQDWLLRAWDQFGRTVLFITHDVAEALYLGDRVIVLSPRPGQVVSDLAVDLPRPRRQSMLADPEFGRQVARLLQALGVDS